MMFLDWIGSLPDWTWLLTAVIALVTLFSVRTLIQIWSLPPGPFPLPILGNILALRGEGNEFPKVLHRLQKKHKDMFTLWLGPRPSVFVCSWDLCYEALITKKNDFSGRILRHTSEIILGGYQDVALADYSPTWETLKKVLSTAVRKYVVNDKLSDLVSDVVDRTTETMLQKGELVDADTMMYLNIYNILASSAFGVKFELDDPVFLRLKKRNDDFIEKFGNGLPSDALPFLKIFYRKRVQEIARLVKEVQGYVTEKFREHVKTYQSGHIRDFTDAILAAKEEAEAEGLDKAEHMSDGNMVMVTSDLFVAGTDTTRILLQWIFLFISDRLDTQRKMREEIDKNIGSRQPHQSDKVNLPYVSAVITETLRMRPPIGFTMEHRTICNTELGGYKLPKDTSVIFYINGNHMDPDRWDEPEKFKPERFLDEKGMCTTTRISHYMPFGLGRRSCPGEKLALSDTFLIVTRLLQKHNFELEGGPGSVDLRSPDKQIANCPPPYKLVIKKRDVNI